MKKILAYSTVLCCLLVLAQSCTKQQLPNTGEQPEQVINATVVPGQTYTFTPPSSGTLTISRQAAHFDVSEVGTGKNNSSNAVVYQYSPVAGYKGADEVALNFSTTVLASGNSGGCQGSSNSSSTYTTVTNTIIIKLNITD